MAWINNNKKNARFNPNKRDDILLQGEVVSRRVHKESRAQAQESQDQADQISVDPVEVYGKKPDGRLRWLQRALLQAARGKVQVTVLYDLLAHPKFTSDVPNGCGCKMKALLFANLHIFSPKQQRFFNSDSGKFNEFKAKRKEDKERAEASDAVNAAPKGRAADPEGAPHSDTVVASVGDGAADLRRSRSPGKREAKRKRSRSRNGAGTGTRSRSRSPERRKEKRKRSRSRSSSSRDSSSSSSRGGGRKRSRTGERGRRRR